jgi:hypothetical protein
LTEFTVHRETLAGDPIAAAKREKQLAQLRELEMHLRHDFLPDWERQELRDFVLGLRRRIAEGE